MILQEDMLILSNENISPRVYRMALKGELVLDITGPDQFLHLRVPSPDKVLRRPISISEYDKENKCCDHLSCRGRWTRYRIPDDAWSKTRRDGPLGNAVLIYRCLLPQKL